MILTLEVVGPQAANLGHAARKSFTAAGGSIGRSTDNDWVIPDSYISGTHARIHFRNNRFFVVDSSANGTSLKSRANRLTRGQWYALTDMDRLFLDTVEIRVRVDNPAERTTAPIAVEPPAQQTIQQSISKTPLPPASQPAANPFDHHEAVSRTTPLAMPTDAVLSVLLGNRDVASFEREYLNSPLPAEEALAKAIEQPTEQLNHGQMNTEQAVFEHTTAMMPNRASTVWLDEQAPAPTIALNMSDKPIAQPAPRDQVSSTGRHQVMERQITVDPEYADIFGDAKVAAPASPVPQQAAASSVKAAASSPMLDTQRVKSLLLSALDKSDQDITPEVTDTLTQILRECLQGLLDLQQQREAMKDEFRLSVTKFKPAENNPLRFSANVEDALYNLLVKRNPAYLQPAEAVTSSFNDALCHQAAMQRAINTAFFNMMQQFDPQRFGPASSKGGGLFGSLFGSPENAAWQQYNKHFAELRKQNDGGFSQLFGVAFAQAYQDELDRLRHSG